MNTSEEERKELAFLTTKSLLKLIPSVGSFLHDIIFEFRGRVKQNRLNAFTEILKTHFSISDQAIDINKITSEEFGDLFENVLKKVVVTKGEKKLEYFKNILVKGMNPEDQIEYCEIFTELLSQMQEKQIEILDTYSQILEKYTLGERRLLSEKLYQIQNTIRDEELVDRPDNKKYWNHLVETEKDIQTRINLITKQFELNSHLRQAAYYKLDPEKYAYFIQDLFNKGLLFDEGVGGIGTGAFEIMRITDLGRKLLEYIIES